MKFSDQVKMSMGIRTKKLRAISLESADSAERITADEIVRIAKVAAKRYANRCWWADVEDMTGEATVSILQARRTWDPGVGVPFHAYAYRAALLGLWKYVWRQSTPVSGGLSNPRKNMSGVVGVSIDGDLPAGSLLPELTCDGNKVLEAEQDQARRLRIRRVVRVAAAKLANADLAADAMVNGVPVDEVMAEHGVDVRPTITQVKRRLKLDQDARRLAKMEAEV